MLSNWTVYTSWCIYIMH